MQVNKFLCFDNSGVKEVKCINILDSKYIQPGSLLLVSLRKLKKNRNKKKKLKKGQMYRAIVIRLCCLIKRFTSVIISYDVNGVILFKKHDLVPLGTRIFGPIFFEIRLLGFMKVVSLASYVI